MSFKNPLKPSATAARLTIIEKILHSTTKVIADVGTEPAKAVEYFDLTIIANDPFKEEYRWRFAQRKEAIELIFGLRRLNNDVRTQRHLNRWSKDLNDLEQQYADVKSLGEMKMPAEGTRDDGTWSKVAGVPNTQDTINNLMKIGAKRLKKYGERDSFMREVFERYLWEDMDSMAMKLDDRTTPDKHFGVQNGYLVSSRQQEIWVETQNPFAGIEFYTVRRGQAKFIAAAQLPLSWDTTRLAHPYDNDTSQPIMDDPIVDWRRENEPMDIQEVAVLSTLLLNQEDERNTDDKVGPICSEQWKNIYKREITWVENIYAANNALIDPYLGPSEEEKYTARIQRKEFESFRPALFAVATSESSVANTDDISPLTHISATHPPKACGAAVTRTSDITRPSAVLDILLRQGEIYVPPHRREKK